MDKEKILLDALNTFGNFTSVEQEFNYDQLEVIYEAMNQVLHIADVSVVREPEAKGTVCPHFDTCGNGGKNQYCDLQTFKEIDCFVGQTER